MLVKNWECKLRGLKDTNTLLSSLLSLRRLRTLCVPHNNRYLSFYIAIKNMSLQLFLDSI